MTGDHIRTRLDPLVSRVADLDERARDLLTDTIRHWQRQGTIITPSGTGSPTLPAE